MISKKHNFSIEQGTSWSVSISFSDFDLAGYSAKMQIRKVDNTLQVELSTENEKIELNEETNVIILNLLPDETRDLSPGKYSLEVSKDEQTLCFLRGEIAIIKEITV